MSRDPIGEKRQISLFVFVNNSTLNQVDLIGLSGWSHNPIIGPDGPVPGDPGYWTPTLKMVGPAAGPDVTRLLAGTLADIETTFNKRSPSDRRCACVMLHNVVTPWAFGNAFYAWDIFELYALGKHGEFWLGGKQGSGAWARTVQFRQDTADSISQNKVYMASSVNYAMWGKINNLCYHDLKGDPAFSRDHALRLVTLFKSFYLWAQLDDAHAFTKWGYNGSNPESVALKAENALQDFANEADSLLGRMTWSWRGINMTYGLLGGTPYE